MRVVTDKHSKECVEALEHELARAKAGNIRECVIMSIDCSEEREATWTHTPTDNLALLIGYLEIFKAQCLDRMGKE